MNSGLSRLRRSFNLNLTFPGKTEMVEPHSKTTSKNQNETKTKNQIEDIEIEKGTKEPEKKKEREETGESM